MLPPRVLALALLVTACLAGGAPPVLAGQGTPSLTAAQRTALDAVVRAVERAAGTDGAGAMPTPPATTWQVHVLRASDGSHYVALRALVSGAPPVAGPVVLYVRLASHRGDAITAAERSAVLEWLDGERRTPLPQRAGGSMSVPRGEMPVGNITQGRDPAAESVTALRLMSMERERAARQREAREAERRAALEDARLGRASTMLPFEDFDVAAVLGTAAGGSLDVRRSLTAGPGDYDLTIAWTAAGTRASPASVQIITRRLSLPAATSAFALSELVLADDVETLAVPYRADQQNAHPYALGALEATPARDDVFRVDEKLSVLLQAINPAADAVDKPSIDITFAVSRQAGEREVAVGTLPLQHHNAATLPANFSVAAGHPLFTAVQVPLTRFARGRYRLTVTATDMRSGAQATRDASFVVAGTPDSLLREAPAPGQAFRRDAILTPALRRALVAALTPPAPSAMLRRVLDAAAAGRDAELLREAPVDAAERGTAQVLRAYGLYALGDAPRTVAAQLQQALAQGAPAAPVRLLLGATEALTGSDPSAIASWNAAREGQMDDPSLAALLVDAYMRLGDAARATAMARAALDAEPHNAAAARGLASAHIASGHYADALAVLDGLPAAAAGADAETDFLIVHALYGGVVGRTAPGHSGDGRARLATVGRRYVAAGGPHAALVQEWLAVSGAAMP